jgi:hypothetical protein
VFHAAAVYHQVLQSSSALHHLSMNYSITCFVLLCNCSRGHLSAAAAAAAAVLASQMVPARVLGIKLLTGLEQRCCVSNHPWAVGVTGIEAGALSALYITLALLPRLICYNKLL